MIKKLLFTSLLSLGINGNVYSCNFGEVCWSYPELSWNFGNKKVETKIDCHIWSFNDGGKVNVEVQAGGDFKFDTISLKDVDYKGQTVHIIGKSPKRRSNNTVVVTAKNCRNCYYLAASCMPIE